MLAVGTIADPIIFTSDKVFPALGDWAGIDFYFNPNIVAFAEGGYVLTTGELDGLDHVVWSIGLQYRF